jgi:hypothetical protein
MKKAQADIIGLLVIVILFIIIAFIFIALSGKESTTEEFTQNARSSNILSSLLQYTPYNCEFNMKEIIRDCTQINKEICNIKCQDLIEQESQRILGMTIKDENYQFTIEHNIEKSPINNLKIGNCVGALRIGDSDKPYGNKINLVICK